MKQYRIIIKLDVVDIISLADDATQEQLDTAVGNQVANTLNEKLSYVV